MSQGPKRAFARDQKATFLTHLLQRDMAVKVALVGAKIEKCVETSKSFFIFFSKITEIRLKITEIQL